jgi:hypothetical protein
MLAGVEECGREAGLSTVAHRPMRISSPVCLNEVAVGTIIADRPPHRSVRALVSAYGSYLG